jgi:hypothetical protein
LKQAVVEAFVKNENRRQEVCVGTIDPVREQHRLQKLYRAMSDGELESIGRSPRELTEWAREALHAEMLQRGLEWRESPFGSRVELPSDDNVLFVLRFYADVAKAAEHRAVLKQAGIEAHFFGETAPGPEGLVTWVPANGVRLLVRAAELAKSMEVLNGNERSEADASGEASKAQEAVEKDSKPVILRTYRDITEAMVDRTVLESAGIQCFLYDDNLIRLDWFVSNAVGGAKIVVSEKDAAEAAKILAEARAPGE